MQQESLTSQKFRQALGRFASGVCIVTTMTADGRPVGVTISAFSSLSLSPPLVLFCLGRQSAHGTCFMTGEMFAVNILSAKQLGLSERFASQTEDRFETVAFKVGRSGSPLIPACLAVLECRRSAILEGGDHHIIVGEVIALHMSGDDDPLLRFGGRYATLGTIL